MFKSINPRSWKFERGTVSAIALVFVLLSWADASFAQKRDGYHKFGSFFTTYYYIPNENQYPALQDTIIKDINGAVLAKVNARFKRDLDIEGTGILRNGTTVNFVKRVDDEIRYRFSNAHWGYGVGQCELKPYRTIAVDPAIIPLGSVVYVPAVDGLTLPDGSIHDGFFRADDIGSKILHLHVDLFANEGPTSGDLYLKAGIQTGTYIDVYKVSDPTPGRCQDLPMDGRFTIREGRHIASNINALTKLLDEYAALGRQEELKITIEKLHQLKEQWDTAGQPEGDKALVPFLLDAERSAMSALQSQNQVSPLAEMESATVSNGYPREFNGMSLKPGEVVITFDDGPHPRLTPQVHSTLKKLGIPAAFFQVGENVEAHSDLTKALADDGFIIGNHSYNHPDLVKLTDAEVVDQIDRTQQIIIGALGGTIELNKLFQNLFAALFPYPRQVAAPEFFRSPYGSRNKRVMGFVEKTIVGESQVQGKFEQDPFYHIMWNIDSLDWNDHSPASIEKRVFNELATYGKRGVILMHDIHPQTIEAIQTILPRLQKEGYKLLTLYDMVSAQQRAERNFLKPKLSLTKK